MGRGGTPWHMGRPPRDRTCGCARSMAHRHRRHTVACSQARGLHLGQPRESRTGNPATYPRRGPQAMRHSADSGDGTARAGDGILLNGSYDGRGVLMASLSHGPGELVLCDRVYLMAGSRVADETGYGLTAVGSQPPSSGPNKVLLRSG